MEIFKKSLNKIFLKNGFKKRKKENYLKNVKLIWN